MQGLKKHQKHTIALIASYSKTPSMDVSKLSPTLDTNDDSRNSDSCTAPPCILCSFSFTSHIYSGDRSPTDA